ncbi:MAG: NusG domain II-containing protein [Clostridia bacterium]|jgi:hypothetical protein|nr:NusG domain II-containing protein [Clostridia bacterium]
MRIRIGDILIVLVVVAVSVLLLVLPSRGATGTLTAVIIVDNVEYERFELVATDEQLEFDLHEPGVVIKAQDGQIWFVSSSCADQTCVNTGRLTRAGDIAVCLPNRVIVKIEGTNTSDVDVVAE